MLFLVHRQEFTFYLSETFFLHVDRAVVDKGQVYPDEKLL